MRTRLILSALCLTLWLTSVPRAAAADAVVTADEAEFTQTLTGQEEEADTPTEEEAAPAAAAAAAEDDATAEAGEAAAEAPAVEEPAQPEYTGPDILVNGVSLGASAEARVVEQTMYLSLRAGVQALYPDAVTSWTGSGAQAEAEGLAITATPGKPYLVANGRYLYAPQGVLLADGVTLVPVRVLAKALGASVSWDAATGDTLITASGSGPIASADSFYAEDAVYWLSRIINAESGNQPLNGKVGVGSVILNRVASPAFPNTIYEVIFDARGGSFQFTPARTGSVQREPNTESVIAAKLCLDGAREAGSSLFFNAAGVSCWASRNKSYVTTIGNHSFYE